MLEPELLEDGRKCRVVALRTREGRPSLYTEFLLDDLQDRERSKIISAVRRMAEHGPNWNREKYRAIVGQPNLYELKESQVRVFWFYSGWETPDGRAIAVVTHGYLKKRDAGQDREIERAVRLREEHLREFDGL